MTWTRRRILVCLCTALLAQSAASTSRAACCLTDWLFGSGHTTYSAPYVAPTVYAPPPQACGCAPAAACAPACPTPVPAAAYRISYRPVPTVAYMPVTSTDPCSGCAVTTYQPTRVWTYYGSLTPYQVGYAAPVCGACSACSSCGCAPPSGYSTYGCSSGGCSSGGCSSGGCSSGGCSSCGVPASGCSSCGTSVITGYSLSGGCSSCGAGTVLPGPDGMSQPAAAPLAVGPSSPATLGAPAPAPVAPSESPRTYSGGSSGPLAPGTPPPAAPNGSSSDNRSYRLPTATDASRTLSPPRIQGVPPVTTGPQLVPSPAAPADGPRPEGPDRVTAQPASHASYFQLLASPPKTVPAQTVHLPGPAANLPADDAGWVHARP